VKEISCQTDLRCIGLADEGVSRTVEGRRSRKTGSMAPEVRTGPGPDLAAHDVPAIGEKMVVFGL